MVRTEMSSSRYSPLVGVSRQPNVLSNVDFPEPEVQMCIRDRYTAVSTPGDLLFHIRAKQMGLCFEFASILDEKLKGAVVSVDETHGFRYMDGKAIIGFVDGTENPAVDENPYHFAVIGEEDRCV